MRTISIKWFVGSHCGTLTATFYGSGQITKFAPESIAEALQMAVASDLRGLNHCGSFGQCFVGNVQLHTAPVGPQTDAVALLKNPLYGAGIAVTLAGNLGDGEVGGGIGGQ